MARFAGLGLEPILADSDDDDGDMGFRRSGFGVKGGDDRRGRGGGNDAVSHSRKTKKRLLLFVPPGPIGSLSREVCALRNHSMYSSAVHGVGMTACRFQTERQRGRQPHTEEGRALRKDRGNKRKKKKKKKKKRRADRTSKSTRSTFIPVHDSEFGSSSPILLTISVDDHLVCT